MSGQQQRKKDYIASVRKSLYDQGNWKTSAVDASFLNGVILCDYVLNDPNAFKQKGDNPPFVSLETTSVRQTSPEPAETLGGGIRPDGQ